MGKLNSCPKYYEGPHNRLGQLIRREAIAQHLMVTAIATTEPELGIGAPCLEDVERGIQAAIVAGWARVLDDFSGMVHLNPAKLDPETGYGVFEPWSEDLFRIRIAIEMSLQLMSQAYTGQAREIADAKGSDYLGKHRPPVVMLTDTDKIIQ